MNRRRQEGADRLFELSKSTNDKWTKELSRRLNHYLDAVVTDDRHYVFHSSRHEWKDRADNSDIPEKLSDQMSGHANGSIGRFYGLGASIAKLSAEMDKLNTSFVDWPRLMRAAGR